jgi:hypothetical protein
MGDIAFHRQFATGPLGRATMGIAVILSFWPESYGQTPVAQPPATSGNATGVGSEFELAFWRSISADDDRAQYEAYLAQYPQGTFAALARAKINVIDRRHVPQVKDVPAAPVAAAPAIMVKEQTPFKSEVSVAAPRVPTPTTPLDATAQTSLAAQLQALGRSQGTATAAQLALPPRPTLAQVAPLALPTQFCSAIERNAFYDTQYKPMVDLADQNNTVAVGHMRRLNDLYQEYLGKNDPKSANLFAAESQDYQSVAKAAFDARASYSGAFSQFMAVPVSACVEKASH